LFRKAALHFSFFIFNQGWLGPVRLSTRDQTLPPTEQVVETKRRVGPESTSRHGNPLVSGRGFGPQDTDKSGKVAVVSEADGPAFLSEQLSLGKHLALMDPNPAIRSKSSVSSKMRVRNLTEEDAGDGLLPPWRQRPQPLQQLVVRFSGRAERAHTAVRQRQFKKVNRNLPIDEVVSLSEHIDRSLVPAKLVARLRPFFGLLHCCSACVGLYGVLSYSVARRTGENRAFAWRWARALRTC